MAEHKPRPSTRRALAATMDLLSRRNVRVPLRLFTTYRGEPVEAVLRADGTVLMDSHLYTSVSMAAAVARVRVAGEFAGRKYPQTNGWTFWHFIDADGVNRLLDDLRK